MSLLKGKKGLVMGVANDKSIAWGISKKLAEHGAELAFTYLGDALKKRVVPLAESLKSNFTLSCDVEKKEDQIRYTIQDVEPLEANLEDKIAEVRLTLLDKDAVASLKDILVKDDGPTGSKIIFGFNIDKGRTVTMRLPGRYNFTADTRHTLFRTAGVTDIQEM